MNKVEQIMLDLLRKGRDEHGFVGIKCEFEAEGTRTDELLRLLELTQRADLRLAIKIGGCEAVSDLLMCKLYGASYVIAPMIETPYALSKYADIIDKFVLPEERDAIEFLFNIETVTTLVTLPELLTMAKARGIHGVVFGRVDYTLSRGLARGEVNCEAVTDDVLTVARACRDADLQLVVGGSVSADAIEALKLFREVRLDRFETRKVVFDAAAAAATIHDGIQTAVKFELNWLRNKRAYYAAIAGEDDARIAMMEKRVRD